MKKLWRMAVGQAETKPTAYFLAGKTLKPAFTRLRKGNIKTFPLRHGSCRNKSRNDFEVYKIIELVLSISKIN